MTAAKGIFALVFLVLSWASAVSVVEAEDIRYDGSYGNGKISVTLATGSPGSLGLLKALSEPFCKINDCRINWIKRGSGASLKALKSREADIILVHAPEAEKNAVKEGWAASRTLIGGNEFFIVGPKSDHAGIGSLKSVTDVYRKIASKNALFFSRGDNSGTHKKEMMIWEMTGIKPKGDWYKITNDFMGPTLAAADREKGYFMTDSSTYYVKKKDLENLKVLFRGDRILVNLYHALCVPEEMASKEVYRVVSGFIRFTASDEGQEIIRNFGMDKHGYCLYMDGGQAGVYEK